MKSRSVYLASRYYRLEELRGYADQLRELGYILTSTWLKGEHAMHETPEDREEFDFNSRLAVEDYVDVLAADTVIVFTNSPGGEKGHGGFHTEFGMSIVAKKTIYVVGPRENVFYYLPHIEVYDTWEACYNVIKARAEQENEQ